MTKLQTMGSFLRCNLLHKFEMFQVIQVNQVIQVIQVILGNQVIQVIQVIKMFQVIQSFKFGSSGFIKDWELGFYCIVWVFSCVVAGVDNGWNVDKEVNAVGWK